MKKTILPLLLLAATCLVGCSNESGVSEENSTSASEGSSQINYTGEYPCDFKITAKNSRRFKILQLSDTQVAYPNHLEGVFDLIDYEIQTSNPDLITVNGDIVYGRYDTDGSILKQLCDKFDSYNIPWAPIFGNHDNECPLGAQWQCDLFATYTNCLFKQRSELTGNGNYSIGCFVGEELVHVVYMLDSKGCYESGTSGPIIPYGFSDEQVNFVTSTQDKLKAYAGKNIKGFVSTHVMPTIFNAAVMEKYGVNVGPGMAEEGFEIPGNPDGDFGCIYSQVSRNYDSDGSIFAAFKNNNIDGIFVGHNHLANASVLYEGVRLTFGLKSGKTDEYRLDMLGGTIITLKQNDVFNVEHLYYSDN